MQTAQDVARAPSLGERLVKLVKWAQRSSSPMVSNDTKTVGVHIPDAMRQRLKTVQQDYGLSTYRDAVYLTILTGPTALEEHGDALKKETNHD